MAGMLDYKFDCCDGAIQFDSATQKMKCPYCDTEFDVDTLKGYDEELKDEKPSEMEWTTPGGSWAEGETAGLHTYSCKSCGGEIVGDDTMAASACPFCGNPIVLTGQFAGDLRPDLIIPFKLDKKAAKEKLQEHLKGKTLLPKVFRSQNHIDEIKGVYVPFWLYDSDADAQLRFTATRTRFWSDDDYDYTETSYYSVRRDGVLGFAAVLPLKIPIQALCGQLLCTVSHGRCIGAYQQHLCTLQCGQIHPFRVLHHQQGSGALLCILRQQLCAGLFQCFGQCAAAAQHLNAGRGQLPHDALRQCTAALGLSFGFFFLIHSDLRSYGTFLS